jgi:hypothetical protein
MSKIKNTLLNDLTQEELEQMLYNRYNDDSAYQQWLESNEFVEFVNDELTTLNPIYSQSDVSNAVRYASTQIQINPSEVGKEVYDMLFSEKIQECLNSHRNGF